MDSNVTLKALPSSTVRLIGSSQVITSVFSVIKELVENSLDADATSIDIKLDEYGLEKTEVSDNGCGVKASDVPFMVKRHFTSKLVKAEDLAALETYGFRGEALASLCAVSTLSIITKSADDDISHIYTFANDGEILDKKPSHVSKGTIICAKKLFANLPVRKQYYSNDQRRKDDLRRIENLIMAYSIVKPSLRITLKHGKEIVFQKTTLKDTKQVLHLVFGRQVANQMLHMERTLDDPKLSISAYLPKAGSDIRSMSLSNTDKTFVSVNGRPVNFPELNRILRSYYSNCHALDNPRHPSCVLSLNLPLDEVDVNVDPNKTKVFLQHKTEVKTCLEEMLLEIYGPLDDVPSWHYTENDSQLDTSTKIVPSSHQNHLQKTRSIMYKSMPEEGATADQNACANDNDEVSTGIKGANDEVHVGIQAEEVTAIDHRDVIVDVTVLPATSESLQSELSTSNVITLDYSDKDSSIATLLDCENNEIGLMKIDNFISNDSSVNHKASESDDRTHTISLLEVQGGCQVTPLTDENLSSSIKESISNDFTSKDSVLDKEDNAGQDLAGIDATSWARGTLNFGLGDNSSLLQPVKLLAPSNKHTPGKRSLPEDEPSLSNSAKRRSLQESPLPHNQSTLIELFKTKSAKKPDSAFEIFCQEKRSEYEADEECGNVNNSLADTWENMREQEKVVYRDKCWKETKSYEKEMKTPVNKIKPKQASARDQIASLASQSQAQVQKPKKKLKNRLYSKEQIIPCCMGILKKAIIQKQYDSPVQDVSQPCVIGQANLCDAWFCINKNKVCLLNTHRLMELDIYNRLKTEHILPSILCKPISLDLKVLGTDLVSTLEKLGKACQTNDVFFMITDKRLIANGFKVKCHMQSDGSMSMQLLEICNIVPTYDVSDLKSILEILSQNPDAQPQETRPQKVLYYLQGEAVRMMRQSQSSRTREDIQDLLDRNVDLLNKMCLHDKPILHELNHVSNLDLEEML